MSEDWNTKYGPRRVRRDPPTLDEAIFAAVGITDDQEQQAEIAAALMGLPFDDVLAEVKKQGRVAARTTTWSSSVASSGASVTTSAPAPERRLPAFHHTWQGREKRDLADPVVRGL